MFTPPFDRALKLRFPMDVGGVPRDGRVTITLGRGSLVHAIGILTLENFKTVIDIENEDK